MDTTHRTTAERGYGANHERERERWRPLVEAGRVDCWRCTHPIQPTDPWDMGHNDDDPDKLTYEGPEHQHCSRSAGARKGNALRRPTPAPAGTPSRDW